MAPNVQGRGFCEQSRIGVRMKNQKQKVKAKHQVRINQARWSQELKGSIRHRVFRKSEVQ